jgi:SAM-dependent methyltransferase
MPDLLKVHLGSGPNVMPGWVNVDYNQDFNPEVVADLHEPFPFETETVDFIHSEGCLCQFDLDSGYRFLQECFRILKVGGVMRLLSPDLRRLVRLYVEAIDNNDTHLVDLWNEGVGIPLKTNMAAEVLNVGIRNLHNFVYDEDMLTRVLQDCGFEVKMVGFQQAGPKELQGLDVRSPEDATYMYFECRKGSAEV